MHFICTASIFKQADFLKSLKKLAYKLFYFKSLFLSLQWNKIGLNEHKKTYFVISFDEEKLIK